MNLRIGNVMYKCYDYGHEEIVVAEPDLKREDLKGIPITIQNLTEILGFTITKFSDHEEIMYDARDNIIRYYPEKEYKFEISGIAKFNVPYIHQLQNVVQDLIDYGIFHI
jgi:hypothetical protein